MSQSLFPASNLAPQSQEWRTAVERSISILRPGDGAASSRAASRWAAAAGGATALNQQFEDALLLAQAAASAADDAVSWHEVPPVSPADGVDNPDIPVNQNATWYVCESSKEGVLLKDRVKEVWQWNPPGSEAGGVRGLWVQQRWGTDALGEGAVDYKNLAAAAKGDLEAAKALTGRVDTLSASYEQTKADLEQAKKDLAGVVAGAKDVIISDTEPVGADRKPGNLWVSTANNTTRLYVFDGTANAWVLVEGDDAAQAAAAAAAAQQKAQEALDKVQAAEDKATAAQLAAQRAQQSANGKNSIFYQGAKPTLNGRVDGDLWYDTANGYKMYRYYAGADDFVEADISASDLVGQVQGTMASSIWNTALTAAGTNPVGGGLIANGSITTAHVQGLDAGVITSGYIGSDRIAARSITAAKIAAGSLTSDSGVFGSIDAGDIKTGVLSADRIDANTLRGKRIEGGVVSGGSIIGANITGNTITGGTISGTTITGNTITGGTISGTTISGGTINGSTIATTANGQGDRVEISSSRGVSVWRGNTIYAQMSPSRTNGLALYNPRQPTILSTPEAYLADVSSVIFGATFRKSTGTRYPESTGLLYYSWTVPAPASGRATIIVNIHYETGAQSPAKHQRFIARNKFSDLIFDSGIMYSSTGWTTDSCMLMGLAENLPTSGNMPIWAAIGMWAGNNNPMTQYSSNFASILIIPC